MYLGIWRSSLSHNKYCKFLWPINFTGAFCINLITSSTDLTLETFNLKQLVLSLWTFWVKDKYLAIAKIKLDSLDCAISKLTTFEALLLG